MNSICVHVLGALQVNIWVPQPEQQSDVIKITGQVANAERARLGLLDRVRELQAEQEDRVMSTSGPLWYGAAGAAESSQYGWGVTVHRILGSARTGTHGLVQFRRSGEHSSFLNDLLLRLQMQTQLGTVLCQRQCVC